MRGVEPGLHNFLCWTVNIMFSSLLVCLSVINITEKRMSGYNFQDRPDMAHETIWNTFGMLR